MEPAYRHRTLANGDRTARLLGRPALAFAALTLMVNLVPGAALFVYLEFVVPGASTVPHPSRASTVMLALFVTYTAAAVAVGSIGSLRGFSPVLRWLAEDRAPTAGEQLAVLRQPAARGLAGFALWSGGAVVFAVAQAALGYPGARIAAVAVGILLAAVAVTSLNALLVERLLRPIARVALDGDLPSRPFGIRVLPRLLLSWAFGSGVPLVALLLAPLDQGGRACTPFCPR